MPDSPSPVSTATIRALVPLADHLHVEFPTLSRDRVVAELPADPGYRTVGGGVHGGAQMALADIAAAVVAVLASGDAAAVPATVQSSTNFLRSARGALSATATVLRPGRTTVVDVVVHDQSGEVVSTTRQVPSVRTAGARPESASADAG